MSRSQFTELGSKPMPCLFQFVVVDCEEGLIALASLPDSEFIVGSLADKTCEFGMIKKKILVPVSRFLRF